MMPRVLVIEDHPTLLDSIRRGLQEEGYLVLTAGTLAQGRHLALSDATDAILLDLMLPDGEGLVLLRELRQADCQTPVLVLTARDSIEDRVVGLDAGADDYLVKPFAFNELLARLRVMLRRSLPHSTLRVANLELNLLTRHVSRAGLPLELTTRQFELLVYLMQSAGQVVTREMIAEHVWHETSAIWTNVIEVQINHLRKRIERPGWKPLLHTIRGEGYVLMPRPA